MYPGEHATRHPDRPAFIMANSGEAVSYREFESRSNRLAHLLRAQGLERLDHYAVFMENNSRYLESCAAGYRAGLYYTCINSYLTADELAYIVNNSESKLLITSRAKLSVASEALKSCPQVKLCLVVDGGDSLRSAVPGLRKRHRRASRHADRRREPGRGDVVFVGHHRPAQGHPAPVARAAAVTAAAAVSLPEQAVALPRAHDLPVAGAAVSLGTQRRGVADDLHRRHGRSSWSISIPSTT